MKPLLSIVVPVYNVRSFLEKCLGSILAQTFTDFELIVVDDGSTDGSGELCDKIAETDSRIKVIHKENGGVVSARKAGISAACGKYAGYVDGDDWIDAHMYENMVGYMEQYKCDIVMCDVEHENKSLPFSSGATFLNIDGGYYDRAKLEKDILPKMIYTGEFYNFGIYPVIWNKLYRREKLIKHQMSVTDNINTGEDAACVYPYIFESDSMYFMKGMSMYHYRRSKNQMTASYDKFHFERFKSLYAFFSESELSKSPYANQLDYYYAYCIKTAISNELRTGNQIPFKDKIHNIQKISEFAKNAGFMSRIEYSKMSLHHRMYFKLLIKNHSFLIIAGICSARFIQKLFR